MTWTRLVSLVMVLLLSPMSRAAGLTISKEQMMLAIAPFSHTRWRLVRIRLLKNPDLGFLAKDQSMSLDVDMEVASGKEKMNLAAAVRGQVAFDPKPSSFQLVKPRVEKLNVLSGQISGMDDILYQVRSLFGRELPVIVLFDIKQLSGGMAMFTPNSLTIVENGVSIQF